MPCFHALIPHSSYHSGQFSDAAKMFMLAKARTVAAAGCIEAGLGVLGKFFHSGHILNCLLCLRFAQPVCVLDLRRAELCWAGWGGASGLRCMALGRGEEQPHFARGRFPSFNFPFGEELTVRAQHGSQPNLTNLGAFRDLLLLLLEKVCECLVIRLVQFPVYNKVAPSGSGI